MAGLFEHLTAFDEQAETATRQSLAVAFKRFEDSFGGFLREASSKKEFESRLSLVETDIKLMTADVADEYGGDADKIAKALDQTIASLFAPQAPEQPQAPCENCGGHGCADCGQPDEQPKIAKQKQSTTGIQPESETCNICGTHLDTDQNGIPFCPLCDREPVDPRFAKERPEHLKAQDEIQEADETSKVPPWLKKQDDDEDQEDGGNRKSKTAELDSQPVANPVPLADQPGTGGDIDEQLEEAPSAVGGKAAAIEPNQVNGINTQLEDVYPHTKGLDEPAKAKFFGDTPTGELLKGDYQGPPAELPDTRINKPETQPGFVDMRNRPKAAAFEKALELKEATAKRKFFATKPETGDSTETREDLPTGDESALGGPVPKIDKKEWKPNATNPDGNLKPIKTEGENSQHPSETQDIKDTPDYKNDDPVGDIKKKVEKQDLPSDDENAGFNKDKIDGTDQPTKVFPKGNQANPVTKKALSRLEAIASHNKVSEFEDERNIIDQYMPEQYSPFNGFWSEMLEAEKNGVPRDVIKSLQRGFWRSEQTPEYLDSIGIQPERPEDVRDGYTSLGEAPTDVAEQRANFPEDDPLYDAFAASPEIPEIGNSENHNDTELTEEGASVPFAPVEEVAEEEEVPEASPEAPAEEEVVEDIIEGTEPDGDRTEVVVPRNHEEHDPDHIHEEEPSDDELEDILREIEENPDEYQ